MIQIWFKPKLEKFSKSVTGYWKKHQLSWNDQLGFQDRINIVIGDLENLDKKEFYLAYVEQGEYGGKNTTFPLRAQTVFIPQISCNDIS